MKGASTSQSSAGDLRGAAARAALTIASRTGTSALIVVADGWTTAVFTATERRAAADGIGVPTDGRHERAAGDE
jgi:hypothetical protein